MDATLDPLARILIFLLCCGVAWLPLGFPLMRSIGWSPSKPLILADKLKLVASLYLVIPLVLWGYSLWSREPFAGYGLRLDSEGLWQLISGLGLAIAGLAVLFGIQGSLGWLRWHKENLKRTGPVLWQALLIGLWVGVVEELLFRGFMLNVLKPYGGLAAVVVASIIFALLHLVWEPAEDLIGAAPQLPGLWLMGMVLAYARVLSDGSLNLAWGLHAGWVWGITVIDTAGLVSYPGTVPGWVTGLGSKPLAGLMGLGFLSATAGVLWAVYRTS